MAIILEESKACKAYSVMEKPTRNFRRTKRIHLLSTANIADHDG